MDIEPVGLGRLAAYFPRLGALGFGGPIACGFHAKRPHCTPIDSDRSLIFEEIMISDTL
ncbi:MAG TPA: hypothetical protein VFG09_09440 [Thermodesulfovibrionales bacterium]|nr:hypothetical protein [Thermodesulfovibrionales bacterium]